MNGHVAVVANKTGTRPLLVGGPIKLCSSMQVNPTDCLRSRRVCTVSWHNTASCVLFGAGQTSASSILVCVHICARTCITHVHYQLSSKPRLKTTGRLRLRCFSTSSSTVISAPARHTVTFSQLPCFLLLVLRPRGCTRGLFRSLRSRGSIHCRYRLHWHEAADLHQPSGDWG